MENSEISWCDHTVNWWRGCVKVSPLCDHCYAEREGNRFGHDFQRDRIFIKNVYENVPRWEKQAAQTGIRPRVFCMSLGDFFEQLPVDHPEYQRMHDVRLLALGMITATTHLDWLLLTKRISNVRKMVPAPWLEAWPSHVRLGVSVGTQKDADRDISRLLALDCPNFLSMEPLLEPVDISWALESHELGEMPQDCNGHASSVYSNTIDWVIAGGESGPSARPSHRNWFRNLRDQCQQSDVPFHLKQWGEWVFERQLNGSGPYTGEERVWPDGKRSWRVGKKRAGRLLDGREWSQFPGETVMP